jgi:ABC-type oligopeptide transport system substrate-binding subunit
MRKGWITTAAALWRKGRLALLAGGTLLIFSCRQPATTPIVVTEVVMVEGEEVIVTRLVYETIQIPVTVAPEGVARDPVVLDLPFDTQIESIDPQMAADEDAIDLIENLYVGLTNHNHQTNTIEPELARSWEVTDGGRTWTFHLRDDIFWVKAQNPLGANELSDVRPVRPVTADDVVAGFRRACHPDQAASDQFIYFIIAGCERLTGLSSPATADIEQVGAKALDSLTVQIRLTEPASYFLAMTSLWRLRPVPADVITEMAEEWLAEENLLTSGPYVLSPDSVMMNRIVLHRNPYWAIPFRGNVDIVNLFYLEDEMDALSLWEENNLDLAPVPVAEQTSLLNANPFKVDLVPRHEVFYLGFNFNSPAFRLQDVRQAFAAAIDREQLVREVYGGRGVAMRHLGPPGVLHAPPLDEVGLLYSTDLARQKMLSSNFNDCRLMPPITILISSLDTALHQAQLIRDMWMEELSCPESQFEIQQVQFGTLLASTQAEAGGVRPDVWELGWASYYPDESNWVGTVLHCEESENRQERPCSEVDDLIREAAVTIDLDERTALYRQIETMFFGEEGIMPVIPLYARADYFLRQSWLIYTPATFGGEQFDTYQIDPVVKELGRSN